MKTAVPMLDLIQWRARKTPERPALFFNGRWYSFRELDGRALRLSNRLADLGVKRGDRVGVLANNHAVHIDLLLAAPKLGFIVVPFNIQCDAETVQQAIRTTGPSLIFCDSRQQAAAEASGVPWTRLSDYREWLAVARLNQYVAPDLSVDDPLLLLQTSEGFAELPYRQLLLDARHSADTWQISGDDATVFCLPCHSVAFAAICLPLLYRGGRIALMSRFDADELIGQIALHRATVLALDSTMLSRLSAHADFVDADLSSLRWVASVATPVRPAVAAMFRQIGLAVRLLVPSAIAGPNLFDAAESDDPLMLGAPLPETQLAVAGEANAAGETSGELSAGGNLVFRGYREAPASTAAALHEGRGQTGLAVQRLGDGRYRWQGFVADTLPAGAGEVHPLEVETALLALPAVTDAAVWPAAEASGLIAALVLAEQASLDAGALKAALRSAAAGLPLQTVPVKIILRDPWGRADRTALLGGR